MREAAACENLEMTLNKTRDDPARAEAETEFRQALSARHELLLQQFQKLHDLNGNIIKHAESLRSEVHVGQTQSSINTISYSARSLQSILELIGFQEHAKKPAA